METASLSVINCHRKSIVVWMAGNAILFLSSGCLGVNHLNKEIASQDTIKSLVFDRDGVFQLKQRYRQGDPAAIKIVEAVIEAAQLPLNREPYSVVEKEHVPPSGDKHDYVSLSIYWWPNPITRIPYIHRDGQRNPEVDQYDGVKLFKLSNDLWKLSLVYFFTENEVYASKAANLLRVWFLDPDTHMNPNMNYAQRIPGINQGSRQGIIETVPLATKVIDSVGLIASSASWTIQDHQSLKQWFKEYNDWLLNSSLGEKERSRNNNHGMWYDVQIISFAFFTGNDELAIKTLKESVPKRIAMQIDPDGSQPRELSRTKSFDYSCYNLNAMFMLARIGKKYGIDLWAYKGSNGQSIPKSLDFLLAFQEENKQWPYQQIKPVNIKSQLDPFVYAAVTQFNEPKYFYIIENTAILKFGYDMGVPYEIFPFLSSSFP